MKTNLATIKDSAKPLKKLQNLSIDFETVYDISELIVDLEEKLKAYNKSALVIENKYLPMKDGKPVYIDEKSKAFEPTDYNAYMKDMTSLNNKEVEVKSKPITVIITEELKKESFTAKDMIDLKWIITFKKLPKPIKKHVEKKKK